MSKVKQTKTGHNQSGMASILIVIILMTVMGLVTIGFSRLMNKEVRRALDRQLSTSAFYAATSGMNDAKKYIAAGGADRTVCDTPSGNYFAANGNLSGDGIVKYSCILVDNTPNELKFDLQPGETKVFTINQPSLGRLYFSWENPDAKSPSGLGTSLGQLPKEDSISQSSTTGLLRVAVYPVKNGPSTNAALTSGSRNYFLYPLVGPGGPGIVDYSAPGTNGSFVNGKCSSLANLPDPNAPKRFCNSELNNMQSFGNTYYVRITAMYTHLKGEMEASNPGGVLLPISGNQSSVDVTGTGNDVSQRIRSFIDTAPQYNSPTDALHSNQAICKLFRVPVTSQNNFDTPEVDGLDPGTDTLCQQSKPNLPGPVSGPVVPPTNPPQCPSPPGSGPCGGGCTVNCGGPPQCPSPPGSGPCYTYQDVPQSCLLPDGTIERGPISGGFCRADGGASGTACFRSDGVPAHWGACSNPPSSP